MDSWSVSLAFIDSIGGPEMMLVFVIVLILFGGKKLPEFARGLGKTMREFKKAAAGVEEEFKRAMDDDERKKSVAALPPPTTSGPTILPPNPDNLPIEALAPIPATDAAAAPSMDSIPPPPLIPLGGSETLASAAPAADPSVAGESAVTPTTPAPESAPAATPPPVPTPIRRRDDYS